ncbi:MAG: glycoside hydrolase family 13 protein [Ethanoligenens sp.]
MGNEIYDAWDTTYKSPFGALSTFQSACFFIRPPQTDGVHAARMYIHADGDGGWGIDMQRADGDEHRDAFFCTCALARPGLYWYTFTLETQNGPRKLVRGHGGAAKMVSIDHKDGEWQLTVYDPSYHTPDWLAGGIIYQIFPDRFRRGGGKLPEHMPPDRVLRTEWDSMPEYRAEEDEFAFSSTYFGGNLAGITEKLPYLRELGVTALYLNPIFEAHSNHRYNTADYMKIDPLLGTESDFRNLCKKAKAMGIGIILDGVFGHTGDDSVYFNRTGRYGSGGAFQSKESPYFSWYQFKSWPTQYRCWWNFDTLPQVNQIAPTFLELITGKDGVLSHWMNAGAMGWRLDVADELDPAFIDRLRVCVKETNPDGVVIGEVWEDASIKIAYGKRRHYLLGKELDGVMNYPFRDAILAFLRGGNADALHITVTQIAENYPAPAMRTTLNLLDSHDTERILTALAGADGEGHDRAWKAKQCLSPEERKRGLILLRLAYAILFFLPGVPCVYYGDEVGMEGYDDPFCRRTYPWGNEDTSLLVTVRALAKLRRACPVLADGAYNTLAAKDGLFVFRRGVGEDQLICAVNRSDTAAAFTPPQDGSAFKLLAGNEDSFWDIPAQSYKLFGAGQWIKKAEPFPTKLK